LVAIAMEQFYKEMFEIETHKDGLADPALYAVPRPRSFDGRSAGNKLVSVSWLVELPAS
jgi:hypothetical protein